VVIVVLAVTRLGTVMHTATGARTACLMAGSTPLNGRNLLLMRRFRCVGLAVISWSAPSHRDAIAPRESPGGIRFKASSIRPPSQADARRTRPTLLTSQIINGREGGGINRLVIVWENHNAGGGAPNKRSSTCFNRIATARHTFTNRRTREAT
jgi:hypothetical protein